MESILIFSFKSTPKDAEVTKLFFLNTLHYLAKQTFSNIICLILKGTKKYANSKIIVCFRTLKSYKNIQGFLFRNCSILSHKIVKLALSLHK